MVMKIKKKKGSNRMVEPNRLIPSYNISNKSKYLKVSVGSDGSASMAEWLLQLVDTRCPFGCEGSIPSAGVINFNKRIKQKIIRTNLW